MAVRVTGIQGPGVGPTCCRKLKCVNKLPGLWDLVTLTGTGGTIDRSNGLHITSNNSGGVTVQQSNVAIDPSKDFEVTFNLKYGFGIAVAAGLSTLNASSFVDILISSGAVSLLWSNGSTTTTSLGITVPSGEFVTYTIKKRGSIVRVEVIDFVVKEIRVDSKFPSVPLLPIFEVGDLDPPDDATLASFCAGKI